MKAAVVILGMVLVVFGIIGIFAGHMIFPHHRIERGLGPLRLEHQLERHIPAQPVASCILLIAGMGLVVIGTRR